MFKFKKNFFNKKISDKNEENHTNKLRKTKSLEGKIALVMGASSGIGKSSAIDLAKNGVKVVIAARRKKVLSEVSDEINQKYQNSCKYIICDVSKLSQIENAVNFTIKEFGKIDILVNSFGLEEMSKDILQTTEDEFDKIVSINMKSVYFSCKSVIREMRKQNDSKCSIINISSVQGIVAGGINAIYCGSKHAVNGFTKALSKNEISLNSNIRINSICPGTTKTDMITRVSGSNEGVQNYPEEVASIVSFLASEESSFINGAIITADAGLVCN